MSEQCLGTTRSGDRCRMTGNFPGGYCHLHRSKKPSAPPAAKKENPTAPPVHQTPASDDPGGVWQIEFSLTKKLVAVSGFLVLLILFLLKKRKGF